MFCSYVAWGQDGEIVNDKVTLFQIEQETDDIEFIVVDTVLNKEKPVFLWCQGSLPVPLFCEIEGYGDYFLGGGIVNFDYQQIVEEYHLVVISMPKTPVLAKKENLNSQFQYVPDKSKPNHYLPEYVEADYLENYVNRASIVLEFLNNQKWVDNQKLVVAGHSQGGKVATKLAASNNNISHLGLFSPNPFGRIDQFIRQARLDAQLGKISWEQADSIMNESYDFYRKAMIEDSVKVEPSLKAWKTFSEPFYDDWLELDIPIYLAYGTEDRIADLCDIVPLFFIEKDKNNLTLKRYLNLEHNFFELDENGRVNHENGHWKEVMNDFVKSIK